MQENNSHIKFQYILDSLDNELDRIRVFEELKNYEPIDDDIKGLKLFLENNDYNHVLLKEYLTASEHKFDLLLDKHSGTKKKGPWLKYAAILLPIIGFGYYFLFMNISNNDELYAEYYEKEIGLPVLMGATDNVLFAESMNTFKAGEYENALVGFEELLKVEINNDTLQYYIGCSYMELGKTDIAIEQFLSVNNTSVFLDKADYRLALLFIKKGQFGLAKGKLDEITSDKSHRYYVQATALRLEPVFGKK